MVPWQVGRCLDGFHTGKACSGSQPASPTPQPPGCCSRPKSSSQQATTALANNKQTWRLQHCGKRSIPILHNYVPILKDRTNPKLKGKAHFHQPHINFHRGIAISREEGLWIQPMGRLWGFHSPCSWRAAGIPHSIPMPVFSLHKQHGGKWAARLGKRP